MTTRADWLASLKPGDRVCRGDRVCTVSRLTATLVVLGNGERFRRADGVEARAGVCSTYRPHIYPVEEGKR